MCSSSWRAVRLVAVCSGLILAATATIATQHRSDVLRIPAPEPRSFEVALDELVIEAPSPEFPLASGRVPSDVTLGLRRGRLVSATVANAGSIYGLVLAGRRMRAAFPGVDFALVLYDAGAPRTPATRALLTREVGLILDSNQTPGTLVSPSVEVRAVPGVPGAFVARAADPLAAVELAKLLHGKPGVRSAYPLLKRQEFPR